MRFLADENFPAPPRSSFALMGHGSSDREVLKQASQEGRILLTFDEDFGELARASSLPATCGVVPLRIRLAAPGQIDKMVADLIMDRDDWAGQFSVIEPGRVRMRPLGK